MKGPPRTSYSCITGTLPVILLPTEASSSTVVFKKKILNLYFKIPPPPQKKRIFPRLCFYLLSHQEGDETRLITVSSVHSADRRVQEVFIKKHSSSSSETILFAFYLVLYRGHLPIYEKAVGFS